MKGLLELRSAEQISKIRGETVSGPSFTAHASATTVTSGGFKAGYLIFK